MRSRGQSWLPALAMDGAPASPGDALFLRLTRAITEAIIAGRIEPGERLPGSRTLSAQLSMHRSTVLRAYDELIAEGWLEGHPGRGTFVASALPQAQGPRGPSLRTKRARRYIIPGPSRVVPHVEPPPQTLRMMGGIGDLRLLPLDTMARAHRRALRRGVALLGYSAPYGDPALREQLAHLLRVTRGVQVSADEVLVTRGSQMALYLAARALLRPGDWVGVEALGYRPAWDALQLAGARLRPIAIDAEGLDLQELERELGRRTLRAVYVTPHHQYPTTVALSPRRRLGLLSLAHRHNLAILEDDYDHEFQYEGRPLLPLASRGRLDSVVYIGSLSKVLAPGLRIGFLAADPALLSQAASIRFLVDRQGDNVMEACIAELLEDGEVQRHIRRTQRIYRARRDHCVAGLRARFGDLLEFSVPLGGMALWLRAPTVRVPEWHSAALRRGVEFQPGPFFCLRDATAAHLARLQHYGRFGYAGLREREMDEALDRLHLAWKEAHGGCLKPSRP